MARIPHGKRTESVERKLELLREAYRSGRHDLASSLAESIRDTIALSRQSAGPSGDPRPGAADGVAVRDLPAPWAAWAAGWAHAKPLRLFETVGIGRTREPVELLVAFRDDQITDPDREVRVARVDTSTGALREVPSQVWDDGRRPGQRLCRVAFLADVAAHGEATYLLFHGNPHAERPRYVTDLRARGEGFGLDVENEHYTARLSRQMGQLERLTSKREHGLELYAGGKGHGEPPTIDWAHDYVEEGGFQKLRMRNWETCPDFEVVRGPICVRVRRWGFPWSPVHPLISPSRMHLDVTYVFWSGVPYFIKDGAMEAVVDFKIAAMRDDEWVFSGYSFTRRVWIDRSGKLHEGAVPAEHAQDLWGVGFYHDESRDAFIALWLEHEARNLGRIRHGGAPTLHYPGHGQLWSRYPAEGDSLPAGAVFRQRNAYLFAPFGDAETVERERHRLKNPLETSIDALTAPARASMIGRLARPGETAATAGPKPAIWDALREVKDEQLYGVDSNIVDLGYVRDVRVRAGVASIVVSMPHRGRPVHEFLVTRGGGRVEEGIRERVRRIDGIDAVTVDATWNPPWTITRLTDAGRRALGLE